jgi:hypothetical protein
MLSRVMRRFRLLDWTRFAALVGAAALVLCAAEAVTACPTCKEGVGQADPQGQAMAAGYYYSILFMLSMPVIIITTFSTFAYRAVKRAKADAAARTPAAG